MHVGQARLLVRLPMKLSAGRIDPTENRPQERCLSFSQRCLSFRFDSMRDFPRLVGVRQMFSRPMVEDIEVEVRRRLTGAETARRFQRGASVAITVGSRGIANLAKIVRGVASWVKEQGGQPFVVPSMGSHAGATAEGQAAILHDYGVHESFIGCPIRSSMETEIIGHAPQGFPLYCDRNALQADHLILLNRIKPHTGIAGPFESGLCKMLLIGLGKTPGAAIFHRAMNEYPFEEMVRAVAPEVLRKTKTIAGVAIIENAYDDTARIEVVPPEEILQREPLLLDQARAWMPRLPFPHFDLLLIDRIGKNLSGTGMDTNVVGRKRNDHTALGDERPRIKRIAVRGLTPQTKGNAIGIGIAEFCHARVVRAIDRRSTRINCLTSDHPTGGMLPFDFESDRAMLAAALGTIGLREPADARMVWIPDTLYLERFRCTENLLAAIPGDWQYEVTAPAAELSFDSNGDLTESALGPPPSDFFA